MDPVLATVVAVVTIVGGIFGIPAALNNLREYRKGGEEDKLGSQFKELNEGVTTQVDTVSSDVATLIQTNSEFKSEIAELKNELATIKRIELDKAGLLQEPGTHESPKQQEQRAELDADLAAVVDHFTLGWEANEREDWVNALKHFEAALAERKTIAVTNNLASAYARMSRFQDALKFYNEAEQMCLSEGLPVHSYIPMNRGNVFAHMGRSDEALAAFDESEKLRREQGLLDDWKLAMNRGDLYIRISRYKAALPAFYDAEKLRRQQGLPDNWKLAMSRGNVCVKLEQFDDALAAWDDAERMRNEIGLPYDPGLTLNRGSVFVKQGRYDEALATCDHAERLLKEKGLLDDPTITFNRALVYMSMGNITKACELARKALDMYGGTEMPVHPNILNFIENNCGGGNPG